MKEKVFRVRVEKDFDVQYNGLRYAAPKGMLIALPEGLAKQLGLSNYDKPPKKK